MGLLLNKMYEMKKKPQQYHPQSQKFFPHPSGSKTNVKGEQRRIIEGNAYMMKRMKDLLNINGPYSFGKSEIGFKKQQYYRSQILKSRINSNPYLNYITPGEYKDRFFKTMNTWTDVTKKKKRNNSSTQRSLSGYNTKDFQSNFPTTTFGNPFCSTFSNYSSGKFDRTSSTNRKKKIIIEREEVNADEID